jgi:SAM-dependent methyltransferase
MVTWYDDDALWARLEKVLFGEQRWRLATAEVDQVIALLSPEPSARWLDLCCGPGRHALELARRGYGVTGVDRTACYLGDARRAAEVEKLDVEWVQSDMREFRRDASFDAAINLYTSFGYFEDPADDRRVASNLLACLKPGGRLLMDIMGKEVLARIFKARHWQELSDGTLWIQERQIRSGWDWISVRWILVGPEGRHEHTFSHRLYSGTELAGLLRETGFAEVELFGNLDAAPYDSAAERLVVRATKA